jgi:hypothetical protein
VPAVRNEANITNALLDVVEKRVVGQLPKRMLLYSLAQKVVPKVVGQGKSFIVVIKTQFGESFRTLRESEPLPDPSAGKFERLQVGTKLLAGTFDITALSEAISDGRERSLIDATKDGTKDLDDTIKRNWARMLYLNGDGAVAKVSAVDAVANTITLYAPTIANRWGTTYLREGMRISASANVTASNYIAEKLLDAEITDVNHTTRVVTIDNFTAGDVAVDDFIFISGKRTTSKWRDWLGLLSALDDGTVADPYLTKARSGAGGTLWQSDVTASFGTGDIERALMVAATRSWKRSDMMFTDLISTPGVFNSYVMPFMAGRTWAQGQSAFEGVGGFTKMPIVLQGKKLDWWLDPDCPKGTIFGMPKEYMELVNVKALGFWNQNGSPVRSNTNLVSRFTMWAAGEFICKRPNAAIRIDGVTEIPA